VNLNLFQRVVNGLLWVSFSSIYWQHDFGEQMKSISSGGPFKVLDDLVFMAASNLIDIR